MENQIERHMENGMEASVVRKFSSDGSCFPIFTPLPKELQKGM